MNLQGQQSSAPLVATWLKREVADKVSLWACVTS